jgi:hypothetical protein
MDLISNIKGLADGRETVTIRKDLTQQDIDKLNGENMSKALQIDAISVELKPYKEAQNQLKKEMDEIKGAVKSGVSETIQELYYIDFIEEAKRKFYNDSGELVHERPLMRSNYHLPFNKG